MQSYIIKDELNIHIAKKEQFMIVIKKINNNVAICKDNNNRELVAFGKGIGFPSIPYEITDLRKIDRTFYNISSQYLSLINELSFEIVEFTADQLTRVQDILTYETNSNLVFTLADHITFAIERAKNGIYVNMPSSYEMELDYPQEMKAGKIIWEAIRQQFHVNLSKVEIQGIAMHFINAQLGSKTDELPELEQSNEQIIEQTTLIIERELGLHVQRDTFNYARFATHIQYLLKRVFNESYIDSDNFSIYQSICDEYQEIADCVDKICIYYQNVWSIQLSEEEKLYLILHVNRVCSREDN